MGGEFRRGTVLKVLGQALDLMGQTDRARACWQEALAIYEQLNNPADIEEVRALMAPMATA